MRSILRSINGRDLAPNTGRQPTVTVMMTTTAVTSVVTPHTAVFFAFLLNSNVIFSSLAQRKCRAGMYSVPRSALHLVNAASHKKSAHAGGIHWARPVSATLVEAKYLLFSKLTFELR